MGTLASRELVRFDIGSKLWIDVKRELTYGEQRRVRSALIYYDTQGAPQIRADREESQPTLIVESVADWNLTDNAGVKLPITLDTVDNLNPDVVLEILDAINQVYIPDDGVKNDK